MMLGTPSKLKKILHENELLEKENAELERELFLLNEEEDYKTAQAYTKAYKLTMYRKIPLSYVNTVFYTDREYLQKKATGCFIKEVLDLGLRNARQMCDSNMKLHFAMEVIGVTETQQGPLLSLKDPYRMITTAPMQKLTADDAREYIGKVILAKLQIPEDYETCNYFTLKSIKPLHFDKKNKDIRPPHWDKLRQYTQVAGEAECRAAISEIADYFVERYSPLPSTEYEPAYLIERRSADEIRLVTKEWTVVIFQKDGRIWYADEKHPDDYSMMMEHSDSMLYKELGDAYMEGLDQPYEARYKIFSLKDEYEYERYTKIEA